MKVSGFYFYFFFILLKYVHLNNKKNGQNALFFLAMYIPKEHT